MKETINFLKVRDVKDPNRSFPTDAGIDFFIPKFTEKFIKDLKDKNPRLRIDVVKDKEGKKYIDIPPHERILIPSGLHLRMSSPNRALIAANKSGVCSKQGLIFGAQVIDYSYQGEVHISVINTTKEYKFIYENQKIMQYIETPVYSNPLNVDAIENTSIEEFYEGMVKDRIDGGFGHTDKK